MYFTQEDYRKIEAWLSQRAIKDTDFPQADPLEGNEKLSIIQDLKNKSISVNEFIEEVSKLQLLDFVNISDLTNKYNLTLKEAISLVPIEQRKLGLAITFHSDKCNWLIYQFNGASINQWTSVNCWSNIFKQVIDEFMVTPDEEDITGVKEGNKTILKFKDKPYDPSKFSGRAVITLRKNLVGTEACAIDDRDHYKNILKQDMFTDTDAIYIIKYDFDLDGKVVVVPTFSTLVFQGGSINNGTLCFQQTEIQGITLNTEIGANLEILGNYKTGQLLTFYDNNVYVLKWWSGKDWKTICDSQ